MSSGDGWHGPINVQGIKPEDPERPPARLELRELKKNAEQWNLYLLAMERWQSVDERDPLSWFQIAGIHGQPFNTWPNESWNEGKIQKKADTGVKGGDFRGFCTHTSIIFLTWHGPYLALFEWALHKHVTDIANEFGTPKYIEAAKTFRIPYWDWALPVKTAPFFPKDVFQQEKPWVTRPGKTEPEQMARNPLGNYKFQKSPSLQKEILETYDKTFKIPIGNSKTDYFPTTVRYSETLRKDRDEKMATALMQFYERTADDRNPQFIPGKNLTERTLYILQSYDKFRSMSNNMAWGDAKQKQTFENFGSLEDTHNAIHVNVAGTTGQMGGIETSAFDPIFWLHHTNIDRLFYIWVALQENRVSEDTWVTETITKESTYTTDEDKDYANAKTPLYPFTNTSDVNNLTYWDSTKLQDSYQFGYCYPETKRWEYPNTDEYVRGVLKSIKALYDPASSLANLATAPSTKQQASVSKLKQQAATNILADKGTLGSDTLEQISLPPIDQDALQTAQAKVEERHPLELIQGKQYLEWLVNVKGEKHSLGGKWALHCFIGAPDDSNPYLYQLAPNYVGSVAALGQAENTKCGKCQQDQADKLEITGQIPLTIALVERYMEHKIDSLRPEHVVPFLKDNLYWRVTVGAEIIEPRTRVGGLKVAVVSNEVTIPDSDDEFPIYSPTVVPHREATDWPNNDGTGLRP